MKSRLSMVFLALSKLSVVAFIDRSGTLLLRAARCHARPLMTTTAQSSFTFDVRFMASLIERIEENNAIDKDIFSTSFVPFVVASKAVGYVRVPFAEGLAKDFNNVFYLSSLPCSVSKKELRFTPEVESLGPDERTKVVAKITRILSERGVVKGWRDELLPVVDSFSSPHVFLIERAAYPLFGVQGYGVHINGFVCGDPSSQRPTHLWIGTRSKTKSTWPGMLDNIVAGAQPYGISPSENVVKECKEEANIPSEISRLAKPVGAVSYVGLDENNFLKRDALFCFDMELPINFKPVPVDGEVEKFELCEIGWVVDRIIEGGPKGFKPNCNLVVIHFLCR